MPYDENGVYREPTNADRAGWARAAVQAHCDLTRFNPADRDLTVEENLDEVASDLLCDLAHLLGGDRFTACLETGLSNYAEEVHEEEVAKLHIPMV
jgi:hypothetical protein